jgi:ATP phosphoribosyltransferase regulatory subunit
LGEAGLTRSLLSVFPEGVRSSVRQAIAHLDRLQLENLPLSDELRDRALLLMDLRGRPQDVLQRVVGLELSDRQQSVVNSLKSLIDLLEESFSQEGQIPPTLVLDLSLVQTFDYYTGIVFEVISGSTSGQHILAQGGRYDQLLGLYHPKGDTQPGIGFVFNIEELHQSLLPTGQLPGQTAPSDWLVVPVTAQAYAAAFAHAKKIRESGELVRVEVELRPVGDREEVREYARRKRIGQIAWIGDTGNADVEALA